MCNTNVQDLSGRFLVYNLRTKQGVFNTDNDINIKYFLTVKHVAAPSSEKYYKVSALQCFKKKYMPHRLLDYTIDPFVSTMVKHKFI